MKYIIFGDLHGSDLRDFEPLFAAESPDAAICLGDFDLTETIHQYLELKSKYSGIKFVEVPGNHDHAILNDITIGSRIFDSLGVNSGDLCVELMNDPQANAYIQDLVMRHEPECFVGNEEKATKLLSTAVKHRAYTANIYLDEERFGQKYKTVIIHGAYVGDMRSTSTGHPHLWARLSEDKDRSGSFKFMEKNYSSNFNIMVKSNEKIMIRGHDHKPAYASKTPKKILIQNPRVGSFFELSKTRGHIINPGALYDGYFATIETEGRTPVLKYHKFDSVSNQPRKNYC